MAIELRNGKKVNVIPLYSANKHKTGKYSPQEPNKNTAAQRRARMKRYRINLTEVVLS